MTATLNGPAKLCSNCQEVKSLADFHPDRRTTTGRGSWCKDCCRDRRRRPDAKVKDQAALRKWRRENPERWAILDRRAKLRKYGLTIDQYDEMLAVQGGLCAICRKPPTKLRLAVDHSHQTGEVRGLLCGRCNAGVAMFVDTPETMHRAIAYLTAAEGQ